MATETIQVDGVLAETNMTDHAGGALTTADIAEAQSNNSVYHKGVADGFVRYSYPTPSGNPTVGAGLQTFRMVARKDATGGNTVTVQVFVYENGSQVADLGTFAITSTTNATFTKTWNANVLGTADGSLVEIFLDQTDGGVGNPNNRRYPWYDLVEWTVDYTVGGQTLTQSSRLDNSRSLFNGTIAVGGVTVTQDAVLLAAKSLLNGTITGLYTMTQDARLDATPAFFDGLLLRTLTQIARLDAAKSLFNGDVLPGGVSISQQSLLISSSKALNNGTISSLYTMSQDARLDAVTSFLDGIIHQAILQSARLDAAKSLLNGNVLAGPVFLSQDARHDSGSTAFYSGVITVGGGNQTLLQDNRFDTTKSTFNGQLNMRIFQDAQLQAAKSLLNGTLNLVISQDSVLLSNKQLHNGLVFRLLQEIQQNNVLQASKSFFAGLVLVDGQTQPGGMRKYKRIVKSPVSVPIDITE
jgi:hypothetical protein